VIELFSDSYAQARERFLAAVRAAGLVLQSRKHPLPGRDGETLAIDAALQGGADAPRLLIVSSGCHGIEGYAGSAAQLALLRDAAFAGRVRAAGAAVLYLHALNPHGFSWGRRVTEDNVDLNRNVVDFARPLPPNPAYARLASSIVPERWPPPLSNTLRLAAFVLRHGLRAGQAVVSSGQYVDPKGLFFGGHAPTWSQRTLRALLREHGAGRERIGWIDVHTGLGPRGAAERILAARHDEPTLRRARTWWGEVSSTEDDSSSSARLHGHLWSALVEECPRAEYTGIVLEFGTCSRLQVFQALRADQWLSLHPEAPPPVQQAIRQQMRAAFRVESPAWKRGVVEQTTLAVHEALAGLARAP
jgi:hypothetical protein